MSLFSRRPDQSLTEREVTEMIRPYGQGVVAEPKDVERYYVPTAAALERELNDPQRETLARLREQHDEAEVERVLSCGTAWVIATSYDDGGRHLTHHVLTHPDGIPI